MFTSAAANSLVEYTSSIAAFFSTSFVESRPSDLANPAAATTYPNVVALVFLAEPWMGVVNLTFTPTGLKTSLRRSSAGGTDPVAIRLWVSPCHLGLGRRGGSDQLRVKRGDTTLKLGLAMGGTPSLSSKLDSSDVRYLRTGLDLIH